MTRYRRQTISFSVNDYPYSWSSVWR